MLPVDMWSVCFLEKTPGRTILTAVCTVMNTWCALCEAHIMHTINYLVKLKKHLHAKWYCALQCPLPTGILPKVFPCLSPSSYWERLPVQYITTTYKHLRKTKVICIFLNPLTIHVKAICYKKGCEAFHACRRPKLTDFNCTMNVFCSSACQKQQKMDRKWKKAFLVLHLSVCAVRQVG